MHINPLGSPGPKSWTHPWGLLCPAEDQPNYGVAKDLTKYFKPLVSTSQHHINNTQDFAEQANKVTLLPGECLSLYDVTILFTSVWVEPAINIIMDLLKQDNTLKETTVLLVKDIILLLEFCLHNTYVSFWDNLWIDGGIEYGVPSKPMVANIYMEYFKQKSPKYCWPTPGMWLMYVDDTFVIQK